MAIPFYIIFVNPPFVMIKTLLIKTFLLILPPYRRKIDKSISHYVD